MKHKNSDDDSKFVQYDDENLEHVLAGPDYGQPDYGQPDYGQPDSSSNAWTELDSKEYPNYVALLGYKISKHQILKFSF